MTRNEKINNDFKKGYKQSQLSKKYKLSRQRIEQIIGKRKNIPDALRIKIYNKFNYNCQWCDKKSIITSEIHHIDLNASNNDEKNLTLLCKDCHKKFHKIIKTSDWEYYKNIKKEVEKFIKPSIKLKAKSEKEKAKSWMENRKK